jgi:hypothetical protein
MSDLDLDVLEAVAKEVHPCVKWQRYENIHAESTVVIPGRGLRGLIATPNYGMEDYGRAVAEHIATFDPPTTLALIAELRDSRARIAEVEAENARLLSPERDTTGLTYGDRKAWEHHLDRAVAAEQKVAALAEVIEQVRALHEPVDVWQYDADNGTWVLDEHGEKVLLTRVCRACSPDEVLTAIEDCEYRQGWLGDEVVWPCETWLIVDPNAWVDDLVRLAAAPTPPAEDCVIDTRCGRGRGHGGDCAPPAEPGGHQYRGGWCSCGFASCDPDLHAEHVAKATAPPTTDAEEATEA